MSRGARDRIGAVGSIAGLASLTRSQFRPRKKIGHRDHFDSLRAQHCNPHGQPASVDAYSPRAESSAGVVVSSVRHSSLTVRARDAHLLAGCKTLHRVQPPVRLDYRGVFERGFLYRTNRERPTVHITLFKKHLVAPDVEVVV